MIGKNKTEKSQSDSGFHLVRERNDSLASFTPVAFWAATAASVTALAAIILALIAIDNQPDPKFFIMQPDGNLVEIVPLNMPIASVPDLGNWTVRALTQTFSIDFVRYQQQLGQAEQFFTPRGFELYLEALRDSGNLDAIRTNRFIVTAVATQAPILIREGLIGDTYAWQFDIPFVLTYTAGTTIRNQRVTARVTVVRADTRRFPFGVAISQIVMRT